MDRDTAEDIKHHFDVVAEGLRNEIRTVDEGLRNEIRAGNEGLRSEMRAADEGLRSEIRDVKRHSDVVAESLRSEIRLVAEGVAGLDEKFTQEFVKVREEIGEVKELLVVSYRDLDRRVKPS
ncbi:MAG: hypothetical protein M3547_03905 [Acidobacteriota bacterium]|nr:hypothetical protein [Acidobacteriota bacterium]